MQRPQTPIFKRLIKKFNARGVRYLLIGRQAIVLHGAPLTSFDYDLWVSPQSRSEAFSVLDAEGFEPSSSERDKKPIVTFVRDITKIDVFIVSGFGRHLSFEECEGRADVLRDERERFFLRVASIDDLIRLKEFRGRPRPKDLEDIEYLKKLRRERNR
ncbi:MAG: hypothetical protein HY039_01685 [Nitrospirae bacterium]|nr:hypothetical protein [Nitrospirota bacterium]